MTNSAATEPRDTNYDLKYIYDPNNKPHAVRDAGDKLYTYDPNGNMLPLLRDVVLFYYV